MADDLRTAIRHSIGGALDRASAHGRMPDKIDAVIAHLAEAGLAVVPRAAPAAAIAWVLPRIEDPCADDIRAGDAAGALLGGDERGPWLAAELARDYRALVAAVVDAASGRGPRQ